MWNPTKSSAAVALLTATLFGAACEMDRSGLTAPEGEPQFSAADSTFATNPNRSFVQVERLANPLAMEVFVMKREHGAHDAMRPDMDPGHFTDDYVQFVTQVAGRSAGLGQALAATLLGTQQNPGDKIKVYPNRAAGVTATQANSTSTTVGWLSFVVAPNEGYGGRTLAGPFSDVVDTGLAAIFGTLLEQSNASPGLSTDNVSNTNPAVRNTFPYFPAANPAP